MLTMYKLEFTAEEWEEIEAMSFTGFTPSRGKPLDRSQWIAVAHMALGKAERIEAGEYGKPEDDDDDADELDWSQTLRGIAEKITGQFKPGDGRF